MLLSLLSPGPLPRLLAPGIPDWIGTDGRCVGWTVRDRLFLLAGDFVRMVRLPAEAQGVAALPEGWVIAMPTGFVTVDPTRGSVVHALVDDEASPVDTHPGGTVGVFVEVPSHRLLRLTDGSSVELPDAATRARFLRPWARGEGALWVDFDTLYRLRAGGGIAAVGKAPGPEGLAAGPLGAGVVSLKSDTVVVGPGGLAQRLGERVDAESARFSPDGKLALTASERGVLEIDLASGKVRERWEGHLAPVGYLDGAPLLWDTEAGTLLRANGDVRLRGFAGATAGADDTVLAGPGGAAWNLSTLEALRSDLSEGVCAVGPSLIAQVRTEDVRVIRGATETVWSHDLCEGEDSVEAAWLEGEVLCVLTLDGTLARWTLSGELLSREAASHAESPGVRLPEAALLSDPDEDSSVEIGGKAWPIPADGVVQTSAGWLAFTDDGMLTLLPA